MSSKSEKKPVFHSTEISLNSISFEADETKKTPKQWGIELFSQVVPKSLAGKRAPYDVALTYQYQVADQLYGWSRQSHHYGDDSFELTEAEFLEAVDRALKFPSEEPLPAAIPKVSENKFQKFTQEKAQINGDHS